MMECSDERSQQAKPFTKMIGVVYGEVPLNTADEET